MSTTLEYSLSPYGVVRGENFTFTLTITNPVGGTTQDNIKVLLQFGGNVSVNNDNINPGSKQKDWNNDKVQDSSGVVFQITPDKGVKLAPGDSVEFTYSNVSVPDNMITGEVKLVEYVAGAMNFDTLQVLKLPPQLSIIGYAKPQKIGKEQSSRLYFTSNNASYITVVSNNLDKTIHTKDQGNGATFSTELDVTPETQSGDTYSSSYTLTAYQDSGKFAAFIIVVYTEKPVIVGPLLATPDKDVSLSAKSALNLSWKTMYSNGTFLEAQYGTLDRVANSGNQDFTGGDLITLLKSNPNTNSLAFNLYVTNGDEYRTSKHTSVTLAPAKILYFKYQNPDLTHPIYATENDVDAQMQGGDGTTANKLTVTGPGGPLVQYLGGSGSDPQIQYFASDKDSVSAGTEVTLSWVVMNITKMTLSPGDIDVPVDDKGKGSYTVKVDKTANFVLTDSKTGLTSTLIVTVA